MVRDWDSGGGGGVGWGGGGGVRAGKDKAKKIHRSFGAWPSILGEKRIANSAQSERGVAKKPYVAEKRTSDIKKRWRERMLL